MMSKYFDRVLDMASPATTIGFATNALLLTRRRAEHLLEKESVKFVVSLDAATGEMYRFMRPSSDFERVSHNIKYYTDRLRALRRDRSWVRINMSICETNLEEVPGFVDLANELGVQKVTFNHLNEGLTHIIEGVDGREWDYVKESRFSDPPGTTHYCSRHGVAPTRRACRWSSVVHLSSVPMPRV